MRTIYCLSLLASFLFPFTANAKVITWDCKFDSVVTTNETRNEKVNLIFKVDTHTQKAVMQGNVGLIDVGFHWGNNAYSFTENVPSGAIQTTTITRDGAAVHSRNTVILKEIVAAQHFGKCSVE